ncbi:MAG: transporter substrate-binding domain-containing protein [Treponema sp.]|nr:transporter substrate-binding domain-containing protein [Treponema sp.]
MKIQKIFCFFIIVLTFITSCTPENKKETGKDRSYADYIFSGARIAFEAGDVYGSLAQDVFKAARVPFREAADMLEALRQGRVDAVLISNDYARQLALSGLYEDFEYLILPEDIYVNKAAPIFHTAELRDLYNEWFLGAVADGTWNEVVNRWIGTPLPGDDEIPRFNLTGENGILRVCDTGNYPPLSYYDNHGNIVGFDMDMVYRFAQHLGKKVEIIIVSYDAIPSFVASGRADMSAATQAITDQRTNMIFGEPSIITQAALIVLKK